MVDQDHTLDRLLDLDGEVLEMGETYWVGIRASRVTPTAARPHGISYSLCLFGPSDERLICFDNAHPITVGTGPAKKRTITNDHVHRSATVRPYAYTSAEKLLLDFRAEVERVLKERGVA